MVVGRVAGVPVRVHSTLLIALAFAFGWVAVTGGPWALPRAGLAVFALFGSVFLHELGHVVVAQRFGIRTREIVLLPIGGAAQMALRGASPLAEVLISLGGPVVSLMLGVAGWVVADLTGWADARLFGLMNLVLGLFNLVPVFPLDGGRVLRGALVPWMGPGPAARVTLGLGLVIALAVLTVAVQRGDLGLSAVAVFVLVAQAQEQRVVARLYDGEEAA